MRHSIPESKRIVVKVGTSTLTYENGKTNFTRMEKLAQILCDLMNQGKEVVLVTSGAIGVGVGKLKLDERPKTVREKQAVAAVGQCELMHLYSKFFAEYGHIVGQILLTRDVVEESHMRTNVINTFESLLEKGILPIVNENDSVATDEIESGENRIFGDNDTPDSLSGAVRLTAAPTWPVGTPRPDYAYVGALGATYSGDVNGTVRIFDSISIAPAIPEPSTYALMLAGLAAVGAAARRRLRGC